MIKMCGKRLIRDWHRKKITNFVCIAAILILLLATVNNASAAYGHAYGHGRHAQPTPTPTPTPTLTPTPALTLTTATTGDTIKVYRSATGQIDVLDIETQYLPYVIAAENDIAPFQSMKAQAVASRTYAYYKKEHPSGTNFDIYDDTRDQVYNPGLVLTADEINSVSQTSGIVLRWGGVTICSFYVSGIGDTAGYVTYNEGKSGDDITQSTIGYVTNPPSLNPYNRGAMGQIQANALAENNGYTWDQILKYFYGSDIVIESQSTSTPTPTPTSTPTPTPAPTTAPTGDTIRVYRSATGQIDVLDIETQYLPYVIAAENDIAPPESMKAQAVASRTYAYYKKEHPSGANFDIYDDTRDQVYNPELVLTDGEINSVSQTSGIVLRWGDVIICSFYVSGIGDTAGYVTYNEGKSGDNITQSTIGYVTNPPSLNPYNRGAMGQIQANALAADSGYTWEQILKYFYGSDIIIGLK
jgi:peptidoglycan hydrolase-like amidase